PRCFHTIAPGRRRGTAPPARHVGSANGVPGRRGRMEGLDQLGGTLVFLLAGGWVLWLIGGTLINRRRAASIGRWVYREVRPYGGKLAIRWLTLAAFELTVSEARKPFRQLTLVGFLESREMPF